MGRQPKKLLKFSPEKKLQSGATDRATNANEGATAHPFAHRRPTEAGGRPTNKEAGGRPTKRRTTNKEAGDRRRLTDQERERRPANKETGGERPTNKGTGGRPERRAANQGTDGQPRDGRPTKRRAPTDKETGGPPRERRPAGGNREIEKHSPTPYQDGILQHLRHRIRPHAHAHT